MLSNFDLASVYVYQACRFKTFYDLCDILKSLKYDKMLYLVIQDDIELK